MHYNNGQLLSHEINNPLTYVIGNLELALEELAPDHPARSQIEVALGGALRIAQIVATLKTNG